VVLCPVFDKHSQGWLPFERVQYCLSHRHFSIRQISVDGAASWKKSNACGSSAIREHIDYLALGSDDLRRSELLKAPLFCGKHHNYQRS
jgi:hypothetical protein